MCSLINIFFITLTSLQTEEREKKPTSLKYIFLVVYVLMFHFTFNMTGYIVTCQPSMVLKVTSIQVSTSDGRYYSILY